MRPNRLKRHAMRLLSHPLLLKRIQGAPNVVVLMFHGFRDRPADEGQDLEGKHLLEATFDRLLSDLGKLGSFMSLTDLLDHLDSGEKPREPTFVLTFDDGYESNYQIAFPVLCRHQAPASIFLATRFVRDRQYLWTDRLEFAIATTRQTLLEVAGKSLPLGTVEEKAQAITALKRHLKSQAQEEQDQRVADLEKTLGVSLNDSDKETPPIYRPLSESQITEMADSGLVQFGAHTHTHRIVGRCNRETIREELTTSRDIVSDLTRKPCDLFCYPNGQPGDFSDMSEHILREEGFRCALTTVPTWDVTGSDPFQIGRLGVSDQESPEWTVLEVSGMLPKIKKLLGRRAS